MTEKSAPAPIEVTGQSGVQTGDLEGFVSPDQGPNLVSPALPGGDEATMEIEILHCTPGVGRAGYPRSRR